MDSVMDFEEVLRLEPTSRRKEEREESPLESSRRKSDRRRPDENPR